MKHGKRHIYILFAGTSVWMLAAAGWFLGILRDTLSYFNIFIMALIVLIGAIWLERFLYAGALPFVTTESKNTNEREHRIFMISLGIGLFATIGALIVMWIIFPDKLFEVK